LRRCTLNPLISSRTTGEVVVIILSWSLIEPANLFSLTPSLNLDFFWIGKDSDKKLINSYGALPEIVKLIILSASFEDSKG
jgi:hypothetical protein